MKNNSVHDWIARDAKNSFRQKGAVEIYDWLPFFLLGIALVISGYSIYASYHKLFEYIVPHLGGGIIAKGAALFFTIAIELTSLQLLTIALYFIIKGKDRIKDFIPVAIATIFMYSLNFWLSTNGLANRSAEIVDNVDVVNTLYTQDSTRIANYYTPQIDSLTNINSILGMKATKHNNDQVVFNQSLIKELRADFKEEKKQLESDNILYIQENTVLKEKVSASSYNFFAGVQVLQILLYVFRALIKNKIYLENSTEDDYRKNELMPEIHRYKINSMQDTMNMKLSILRQIDEAFKGYKPEKDNKAMKDLVEEEQTEQAPPPPHQKKKLKLVKKKKT